MSIAHALRQANPDRFPRASASYLVEILYCEESKMSDPEIVYHGRTLIPLATFDEALYAAILLVRGAD